MNTLSPKDRKHSRQKQRDDVPLSEDDYPWFVADDPKLLESLRAEKKRAKRDNRPASQTSKEVQQEKPHTIDMKSHTSNSTSIKYMSGIGGLLSICGISGIIFSIFSHRFEFVILSAFFVLGGFGFVITSSRDGIPIKELAAIVFIGIFVTVWILVFTQVTGITNIPWIDRSPHGWGGP